MRTFRSPNSGQTSLKLQHATSPRSGYRPPAGHNADGYMMPERVGLRKGGSVSGKMRNLPDHLRHSLVDQAKSRAKKGFKRGGGVDVEKAKEFRKNRKKPIRTFIKNTLEGKYMGDGSRGTAEPKRVVGNRRVRGKMGGGIIDSTKFTYV